MPPPILARGASGRPARPASPSHRPDPDHLAAPSPARERQRHLQQELQRAVHGAGFHDANERVPASVAQDMGQAPEIVPGLRLVPAPDYAATRLPLRALERLRGEGLTDT